MVSLLGVKPQILTFLQERVLRLMHFSDYKSHIVPLFVSSQILPVKLLYFKLVASFVHDVANQCAPPNISNIFIRSEKNHPYPTRPGGGGGTHIKRGGMLVGNFKSNP